MRVDLRFFAALRLGCAAWLLAGPAAAAQLTQVSASPNSPQAGANVTVTVHKSGGGKCGAKVDLGNGTVRHVAIPGGQVQFTTSYPSAGSYTVRAWGRAKGRHSKCRGGTLTTVLQVGGVPPGNPGNRFQRAPSSGNRIKPRPPRKGIAEKAAYKWTGPPKIRGALFAQGNETGSATRKLSPGGTLTVIGSLFGPHLGKVHLKVAGFKFPEYPNGIVPLQIVKWESTEKVIAKIPTGMTGPLSMSLAQVVVTRSDGETSPPLHREFQVPVERKVLGPSIAYVMQCSEKGSSNRCPKDWKETAGATISGDHYASGLINHTTGTDRWRIQLKDGWTFRSVTKTFIRTDDTGETVSAPFPPMPHGGTDWAFEVHWNVSPHDNITYGWWIEVQRAQR